MTDYNRSKEEQLEDFRVSMAIIPFLNNIKQINATAKAEDRSLTTTEIRNIDSLMKRIKSHAISVLGDDEERYDKWVARNKIYDIYEKNENLSDSLIDIIKGRSSTTKDGHFRNERDFLKKPARQRNNIRPSEKAVDVSLPPGSDYAIKTGAAGSPVTPVAPSPTSPISTTPTKPDPIPPTVFP